MSEIAINTSGRLQRDAKSRSGSIRRIYSFVIQFKKWSWIIIGIAAVLQIAFWTSLQNIYAVGIVLAAWKLIDTFILKHAIFLRNPLSSFLVLGMALTQFFFPIVFTLLEGHPLIHNLNVPYEVFLHSFLALLVLIMAHGLYRMMLKRYSSPFRKIQSGLTKLKFFKAPDNRQIWMMGLVGLVAMFYVYFYSPSVGNDVSGAGNKFIQGLIPFTYAPFYILIQNLYGGRLKLKRSLSIRLTLFTVLLFIVSIGRNSRGAFMFGFAGLGVGYFLGLMLGIFSPKIVTRKSLFIGALIFWLITGPLADLGTAMLMVRTKRKEVSRAELLPLTWEQFKDKDAIERYRETASEESLSGWDERYLDNIFLARFCNLKFNDASLEMADKLGGIDPLVTAYAIERPFAVFPQPIIDIFNIEIDKKRVNSYSSGDFLFDRVGGVNAKGGFRIGHFAGFGMASFGWAYLLILFCLIIPAFFLWDLLAKRIYDPGLGMAIPTIGLGVLMSLTYLLQFMAMENVLYLLQFLLRGWFQMIFLYLFLSYFTRIASSLISKK